MFILIILKRQYENIFLFSQVAGVVGQIAASLISWAQAVSDRLRGREFSEIKKAARKRAAHHFGLC